jgi:putative tricarboxylic transport membrane protein
MTRQRPVEGLAAGAPAARWPWAESAFAGALVAVGGFTLVQARTIVVPGSANTVGPQAFPYAVGILLIGTGAAVLVALLRGRRGEAEHGEDVDDAAGTDWLTVAKLTGSFAALVVLLEPAGWVISATALFAGTSLSLGARPWWRPVVIGVLLAVLLQVAFTRWLGVFLPAGPLEGVPFLHG